MSDPAARKTTDDFVSDITANLMDENLQERFGTSLEVNMGREYQRHLLEKYRTLQLEFKKINKDSRDGITVNELIDFLNTNQELVRNLLLKFYSLNKSFQGNMERKYLK